MVGLDGDNEDENAYSDEDEEEDEYNDYDRGRCVFTLEGKLITIINEYDLEDTNLTIILDLKKIIGTMICRHA